MYILVVFQTGQYAVLHFPIKLSLNNYLIS